MAREANDAIKDNIWRELAQAKYAQWQRDSADRKAKLETLKVGRKAQPWAQAIMWEQEDALVAAASTCVCMDCFFLCWHCL